MQAPAPPSCPPENLLMHSLQRPDAVRALAEGMCVNNSGLHDAQPQEAATLLLHPPLRADGAARGRSCSLPRLLTALRLHLVQKTLGGEVAPRPHRRELPAGDGYDRSMQTPVRYALSAGWSRLMSAVYLCVHRREHVAPLILPACPRALLGCVALTGINWPPRYFRSMAL